MSDIANLQIRIESLEAALAARRLSDLASGGNAADGAINGLMATMTRFAAPLAVAAGGLALLKKSAEVQREFDIFNAQLITATGSAENATEAFEALRVFAEKTPYDLQQATDGFTQLVNLGLTPSERAMLSYGNTASAMGKSLSQMIEAVADAATGEFERLKEFGIKASKEGDRVTFTFRGMKTEVGNNAAEIEKYLMDLGEVEFAGAMEERMSSFDGAMANLGDSWDNLFRTINDTGLGEAMEGSANLAVESVEAVTGVFEDLNAYLESGAFDMNMAALGSLFETFGTEADATISFISSLFEGESPQWVETVGGACKYIVEAFLMLPYNIKAVVRMMAVELSAIVSYAAEYGRGIVEVMEAKFKELLGKAKVYAGAIANAFNPFSGGSTDVTGQIRSLTGAYNNSFNMAFSGINKITQARNAGITGIMNERSAVLQSYADQQAAARKAHEDFTRAAEAEKALSLTRGDVLGKYYQGSGGGSSGGSGSGSKAKGKKNNEAEKAKRAFDKKQREAAALTERLRKQAEREEEKLRRQAEREDEQSAAEFQRFMESLQTESEKIESTLNDNLALIEQHTEAGSALAEELTKRVFDNANAQSLEVRKREIADFIDLQESMRSEEQVIEDSYSKRMAIIMAHTEADSELRDQMSIKAVERYEKDMRELELARSAELDGLVESLRTEEEVIADSYQKRLAIILENTEEGSEKKAELLKRLDEQFATDLLSGVNLPEDSYAAQMGQVEDFYTRRMELILENVTLTEEKRTELELALAKDRDDKIAAIETARWQAQATDYQTGFDGLVSLTKTFAGEQAGAYKIMFAASKAFAIADAVVKIQQGIAAASALPFPLNLGAITSTIAATAGVLATINSTRMELAGAYDKGGMIPSGKVGLVGEFGPELIKGPAIITGRERTAELRGNQSVQKGVTVNIINNVSNTEISTRESSSADGEIIDVIIDKAKKEVARDIREGGGIVGRSMENTYGIKRGAA